MKKAELVCRAVCSTAALLPLLSCEKQSEKSSPRHTPVPMQVHVKWLYTYALPADIVNAIGGEEIAYESYKIPARIHLSSTTVWLFEPRDVLETPALLVSNQGRSVRRWRDTASIEGILSIEAKGRHLLMLTGADRWNQPYVGFLKIEEGGELVGLGGVSGTDWQISETLSFKYDGRTITVLGMDPGRYDLGKDARRTIEEMGLQVRFSAERIVDLHGTRMEGKQGR